MLSVKQKVRISGEFVHFGGGGWDDLLEWGWAINLDKCSLQELVSVRLSADEVSLLRDRKVRDVTLRGTFDVSVIRDSAFLHSGFIVKVDERK